MVRLCFRFDDPSATSNHALEREIIAAFARRGLPFTAAVIPFRQTGAGSVALRAEDVGHLIEAQAREVVEIAQHGLEHVHRSSTPAGKPSELHSLPEPEQREMIERGAAHLGAVFGQRAIGFVPPWNSYDASTVTALERLGFRYVSAAWNVPRLSDAVATLPLTCWLHNLVAAVDEAKRFRAFDPVVVAVFHHYDFKESGEQSAYATVDALGELLDRVRAERTIAVSTLAAAASAPSAFGVRCHAWRKRLPWRLRFLLPQYALLSSPLSRGARSAA